MRILLFSAGLACSLLLTSCYLGQNQSKKSGSASQRDENYQLPSDITIDTVAERGQDGQIFLSGSTNLPDGIKIGVEIQDMKWEESFKDFQGRTRRGTGLSQDMSIIVDSGHFRSQGFRVKNTPYPPGPHKVHFFAYFNGVWQNNDILKLVGAGGKKLRGKIFKKSDPDVIDSDLTLDYTSSVLFPPMSQETVAINIVKNAILTVPDRGRSSMTVEKAIEWYMQLIVE